MRRCCLFLLLLWVSPLVFAEDQNGQAPVPEPPELPEQVVTGEAMSPDITIIQKGDQTVEEYRINGALYMIKIIPNNAPAYYIVDNDGDGNLETRRRDLEKGATVPQWLLHSW